MIFQPRVCPWVGGDEGDICRGGRRSMRDWGLLHTAWRSYAAKMPSNLLLLYLTVYPTVSVIHVRQRRLCSKEACGFQFFWKVCVSIQTQNYKLGATTRLSSLFAPFFFFKFQEKSFPAWFSQSNRLVLTLRTACKLVEQAWCFLGYTWRLSSQQTVT